MTSEEIDASWDFGNPPESETRFRKLLETAGDDADQVKTQLARSLGLQRRFDEAQAVLDTVAKDSSLIVGARWNLEQGRVKNSSGQPDAARPFFEEALRESEAGGFDFYTVDALHMLGIVTKGQESLDWNMRAIAAASASDDERAKNWKGSLLNNTGWTLHDMGKHQEALDLFERALEFRKEQGKEENIRIAEWCVARCLRSLGRIDEALARQRELLPGDKAGYANEETGECLLALGRAAEAAPYFATAYEKLSEDQWLVANEPARLERMKKLAAG
ncbi:MAG: tetratricopeptide repeat protein [Armatimonadetes bacterium]|nr:tetratricopeptide repeat protein [Armatimonadota bacterium]